MFKSNEQELLQNHSCSSLESTTDGNSVVLGMVDGNLTVLTIADPKKPHMKQYLKELPSRYGKGDAKLCDTAVKASLKCDLTLVRFYFEF